jgi:phosphoglycerate dehydrogenase-like enzyme
LSDLGAQAQAHHGFAVIPWLWHHPPPMGPLCVLEFVRDKDQVWNLPPALREALVRQFPDVRFISPADQEEADRALPEAEVVLGWAVRPHNFERAERLRWIQVTAASVASLLFPALAESDVVVTNGRGLHAVAMAEHTLGVLLMFSRKLHLARDAQQQQRWAQRELSSQPPDIGSLEGTRLGLVGFGSIGQAIATRASALGMSVVALRRHPAPDPAPAHEQWGLERLPELLERCDWLVLAAPLTEATRRLIGKRELLRMPRHAVLVNLGRGPLVDEPALIEALQQGRIAGAALDVFEEEPLSSSSPLWSMSNVIVTPHLSGFGPRLWERAMELFARNLRAFMEGRALENVVDKRAGY